MTLWLLKNILRTFIAIDWENTIRFHNAGESRAMVAQLSDVKNNFYKIQIFASN